ncbi:MAG: hypothetical protein K0S46_1366 [Moraxellaceae bacterium]|jgi:tryptophan-rich hypothetical protein|nr:hypothetical protein [Moraxellaceae bacterium]
MNRINPKKLLQSKWTAVAPVNREKHFVVVKAVLDEEELDVEECVIEAVLTRRQRHIDWQELKDDGKWRFGWQ